MTMIDPRAHVDPTAELASDVVIAPFAYLGAKVKLGAGCRVGPHAVVLGPSSFGPGNIICAHAVLGGDPQDLKHHGGASALEAGAGNVFRELCTVNRGTEHGGGVTRIGDGCYFMAYSHVAHDCQLGSRVILTNASTLGGHVVAQDAAVIGGLAAVAPFVRLGRLCFVAAGAMVPNDVPPFVRVFGDRARVLDVNTVGLERNGLPPETIATLKAGFKRLARPKKRFSETLADLAHEQGLGCPELVELVEFIQTSKLGICPFGKTAPR